MNELQKIAQAARDERMGSRGSRAAGKMLPSLHCHERVLLLIERLAKELDKRG